MTPAEAEDPPPDPSTGDADILEPLRAGSVDQALALANAAIDHDEAELHRPPGEVAARIERLAMRFYEAGTAESLAASQRLYARALTLRESDSERDPGPLAALLHNLSGLSFNSGELDKAESAERRALAIRERIYAESDPRTAESRRDLGLVLLAQGRLSEAAANLIPAVEVIERSPEASSTDVAIGRNYLAELARLQGDYARAGAILERLVQEAGEHNGESNAQLPYFLNNLAGIYRDQERFDQAETLLRRSLTLRKEATSPDLRDVAGATLNLAELFRTQGKLVEAEPLYVEALANARSALGAGSPELFEFLTQLAVLYRDQGAFAKSRPLLEEALALAEKGFGPENLRTAQGHLDLAELLRRMGRCSAAAVHYQRALTVREKVLGSSHPDVAEALTAQASCLTATRAGRPAGAAALDRAIGILAGAEAHPASAIDALSARALLLRPKDHAKAALDLAEALRVVERMRPHRGGDERARSSFFGRYAELYQRMVEWQVEDRNPEKALEVSELARARVLLDQLAAAHVGEAEGLDPALEKRLMDSRTSLAEIHERIVYEEARQDLTASERTKRVSDLESRLSSAEREFRRIHDEARNASPAWRSAVGATPPSLREIQRAIVPKGGWLLVYEIGGEASFVFAIPASGPMMVRPLRLSAADGEALGVRAGALTSSVLHEVLSQGEGGAAVAGTPRTFLSQLAAPQGHLARGIGGLSAGPDRSDRALHALWKTLVPPALWSAIRRAGEVLVVPDGELFTLPFEALVLAPGADSRSTRYWLDDGPVVRYSPSATFLYQLRRRESDRARPLETAGARPALLSVSDPAYDAAASAPAGSSGGQAARLDPRALPRLPGTAAEADAVRRAFGAVADVVVLSGDGARERAVRDQIGGKRYVHIATHGLVDQQGDELFAALALSPPPASQGPARGDDDGLLQLFEIYDLGIDCDLAVLSACKSNTGRLVAGEGVFALSRAFLVAGARRVVATQWSVEDASTAVLVGEVFQGVSKSLASGHEANVAIALRDAKRKVRRNPAWAAPFYWAPFVLTGL